MFFKVVGLDNLDIFFAGKNSPWRGLGRASMPGRWRGRGLLEQGGAQVGHGGVSLAWAREFEVYDMVVHFRMSGNDSLDVICSMLCAFAAPEAQDHEQGGAQGGHGGGMAPWAGEFELTGFSFQFRVCEYETNVFDAFVSGLATNQPGHVD